MAIQKVSVWDAMYADMTSEDKVGSGYGRWKGILNLPYPVSDFVGKLWVTYDSPEEVREFANFTAFATGIGWHVTESDQFDTSGPFDTSTTPGGQHPVLHIDAEMEVEEEESDTTEVLQHSNKNDRLLAEHFTKQLTSKANDLTTKIDANTQRCESVSSALTNAKFDLNTRIDTTKTEVDNRVTEVRTELVGRIDSTGNRLTQLQTKIIELSELAPKVCGWSHSGYFTMRYDSWTDILGGGAGNITGNTTFIERVNGRLILKGGVKTYDRILKILVTSDVILMGTGNVTARLITAARKSDGTVFTQTSGYYVHDNGQTADFTFKNMQYALEFRIPANSSDHPLLRDGLALSFARVGSTDLRLNNPQVTCYCFGTV